ncbi:urease accessory protein UreD [Adhaeribacter pallidiroseus]|uniref:Urease accessory protein UreD n=1 Tax=Adhaeribacter pallidiroseus TaxID=2072847 RepID=A0A369QKR5_9BACT|nr:urease accessory protein UreD [Adhaeribacter pallidiroseus]RDC62858.1 Urease accessory protein UreD [Adhaeribacter pallidiroseus]
MIGELTFTVANRTGKSFLGQAYCTHPFKIAPVGEHPENPTLYLMIRSSSPGVLDNDHYKINIHLNSGSRLHLQTQSYQRIFKMDNGARQEMVVNLAAKSYFCFIPHPVVPHENSRFYSHTVINMAEESRLVWGEIITCGRKLSGEAFKFTSLHTILKIYNGDRLIFKDQLLLCPGTTRLQNLGLYEDYSHQANLVLLPAGPDAATLLELVQEYFLKINNVAVGLTEIASNGILIRILGTSGEQLFSCLQEISALLLENIAGSEILLSPEK